MAIPPPPLPPLETHVLESAPAVSSSPLPDMPRWAKLIVGAAALGVVAYLGVKVLSKSPSKPSTAVAKTASTASASKAPSEKPAAAAAAAAAPATAAAVNAAAPAPTAAAAATAAPATSAASAAPATSAAAPKAAQEMKKRGNDAYKDKNYTEAIAHYTKALELTPETDEERSVFFCNRAACHLFLDNIDAVIADCSEAIKLKPKYVKAYNRRAQAYEKKNDLRSALYDYTAICFVEKFTNDAAQKAAERVLAQLGKDGAIEHLKNKVPAIPSSSIVRMYFDGYKKLPVPATTLEALNDLLAAEPDNALALHQRAVHFLHAREFVKSYDDAVKAQDKLKESHGTDELRTAFLTNCSMLASFYLLRGTVENAIAACDDGLAVDPTFSLLMVKRATCKVEKGQVDDAMKDFEAAIAHDKNEPDAYYQRGQVYALMQSIDKALADFQKAVDSKNATYPAYVQLAVMQVSVQNIQGAMKTFENACKRFPEETNVFTYYGEVLMAIQQFPEAEKMFNRALEVDSKNATAMMHKGWLLLQAKSDVVSAVTLLGEAIAVDPNFDQAYNRLAAILIQQGLFDKAIECYDKAIENNHNIQDLANTISCREAAFAQKRVMLENPSIIPEGVVVPQGEQ